MFSRPHVFAGKSTRASTTEITSRNECPPQWDMEFERAAELRDPSYQLKHIQSSSNVNGKRAKQNVIASSIHRRVCGVHSE